MSEKTKKNVETVVENVEAVEEKTEKKVDKETKKEKQKVSWFKRAKAKVRKVMSDHPVLTAVGGAFLGSAATVGVAEVGKQVINRRQAKQQQAVYIPEETSTLDPNN